MQVIAFLITYFSDDLRNTYMLQVFLRYFASYIRVHPIVPTQASTKTNLHLVSLVLMRIAH